jgi:hypothetical protein
MWNNKLVAFISIIAILFVCQALTPSQDKDKKKGEANEDAKNLKVLSKKMSHDDLIALMKVYSKSLGVKCNHCHAQRKDDAEKLDFASDEKPEKGIARKMIKMTADINKKYISKMDGIKEVRCVTCHNGHIHPVNSVDSLAK